MTSIGGNASKDGIVVDVYAGDNTPFFCTAVQQQKVDTRFMPRAMLCARQLKDDISRQDVACVLKDVEVYFEHTNENTLEVSFRGRPTCFDAAVKALIRKGYILCSGTHVDDSHDCTVIINCNSPAFDNLRNKTNERGK